MMHLCVSMLLVLVRWRNLSDWYPCLGFIPAVNSTYNNGDFTIEVSSIERLKQFFSWQRDCVIVVNLWTEFKAIFENWW